MDMPERSFGRTVRYRRTKLGLSQAKLAELVGRSTPTIRSWERDKSRPNDADVLAALAAVLGVDERHLFDKADVERPALETSPSVEQALATLAENENASVDAEEAAAGVVTELDRSTDTDPEREPTPVPVPAEDYTIDLGEFGDSRGGRPEQVGAGSNTPAYVAPPEPYDQTPLTPTLVDVSYMEDRSQRQLYRVRTLATLVAIVALVIAFIWALGEGLGALDDWWDGFFGNLRL